MFDLEKLLDIGVDTINFDEEEEPEEIADKSVQEAIGEKYNLMGDV